MKEKRQDTLFWHDYETFGADPQKDRPSQFAGIRTDVDLNIIEDPVNIYCKLSKDYLPHPIASLITKITPQIANERGLNEASFFNKINRELGRAGTCGVGYNSLRFDDEVTRNGFYKNMLDPYEREWKNGNSRWDLINVVRLVNALRPGLLNVTNETGDLTFRLEELSRLNGFAHENAHDALSDIYATIALAKHMKEGAPDLYSQLYEQRLKKTVQNRFELMKPFLLADSFFGAEHKYTTVVMPVAYSSKNVNEVYCIKLSQDIEALIKLSPEDILKNLYTKKDDRDENYASIPIHSIQINKIPAFVPASQMNKDIADSLNISGELCKHNMALIKQYDLSKKVIHTFSTRKEPEKETRVYYSAINNKKIDFDPDVMLYGGAFMSNETKKSMTFILQHDSIEMPPLVARLQNKIDQQTEQHLDDSIKIDSRLPEMLFRYIGRNYSDILDKEQKDEWDRFCLGRITDPDYNSSLTVEQFNEIIKEVKLEEKYNNERDKKVIESLEDYVEELIESLKKKPKPLNKPKI